MKDLVIAKRYGNALFELGIEEGNADGILRDMQTILSADKQVSSLLKGLSDERIDIKKRLFAADEILNILKIGAFSAKVVKYLIVKDRIGLIHLIAEDLQRRLEKQRALAVSKVSVADEKFAGEVSGQIAEIIGRTLKRKARCDSSVDKTLIDGFVVWLGSRRYDASIKGKLERMREENK